MPWKGHNHLSMLKPATFRAECKKDVPREPENCVVSDQTPAASCGLGMTNDAVNPPDRGYRRHYKWPWFVLAAVLLAIALAVLWMSKEIARTRRIRDLNEPPPATNRAVTSPGPSSPAAPERV
jgi:hypothetical protein